MYSVRFMQEMWSLLAATFRDWYEDRAQRLGAALAYYTIFALTPGLVLVIALAGFLLGQDAEGQILGQIRELIGEQGAAAIEATTRSARTETLGVGGTALALFPLVFGLWGLFGELQDGLNTIWGVTPKAGRHVIEIVKERFWSFAMVGRHRVSASGLARHERLAHRRRHLLRPTPARTGRGA
jgi:membrane protein